MTEENKKLQWAAEVLDDWYGGTGNPSEKVKNTILDFAKEYHTLKNMESSSRIMVSSKALEELKSWAYNNVQPHDDECHDIISRL